MNEYEKSYYLLFNGISEVTKMLENTAQTTTDESQRKELEVHMASLRRLQQKAEELFIEQETIFD